MHKCFVDICSIVSLYTSLCNCLMVLDNAPETCTRLIVENYWVCLNKVHFDGF
jgi:hypothetical protein